VDEPTSALDPPNALLVVETISRLRASRALSIVAVTHQPDLVRRLGGGLLYLRKGRVEAFHSLEGSDTVLDARLQAFLAGENVAGGGGRAWAQTRPLLILPAGKQPLPPALGAP